MDSTYLKELAKIRKADLLILDDFGLHAFDNYSIIFFQPSVIHYLNL